jgi:glyoxylate reductase
MKPKILVTRAIFPQIIQYLSEHFDVEDNQSDAGYDDAELVRRLQGKVGVFASPSHRFAAELFAACPNLKAVCNMAVGYNNIDVPAATAAGVMVTNTPDVLNETTADFAWTLMMAAARRVSESEHYLRAGLWKKSHYLDFLGVDVIVTDIIMIGSLVNYNWSKYSDIDLHIVVNFNQFPTNTQDLYLEFFEKEY